MNPLKFEIHIGNQLQDDIKKFKAQLNDLLQNRTIKIGVDSQLSTIMSQLLANMKSITEQQAKSAQVSEQAAKAANKEAEAYQKVADAKEKASKVATTNSGGQYNTANVEKLKSELNQSAAQIDEIVAKIQKSINDMGKGINVDDALGRFRQAVQSMAKELAPFEQALAKMASFGDSFAKTAATISSAAKELQGSFQNAANAQKQATEGTVSKSQLPGAIETWNRLQNALNQVEIAYRNLSRAQLNHGVSQEDLGRAKQVLNQLSAIKENLQKATQNIGSADSSSLALLNSEMRSAVQNARSLTSEITGTTRSVGSAKVAARSLATQIQSLEVLSKNLKIAGLDASRIDAAIIKLQELRAVMQDLRKGKSGYFYNTNFNSASDLLNSPLYKNGVKEATEAATQARRQLSMATRTVSAEEGRMAQAFRQSTHEARAQSQVLGDLKSMMAQYFSIYGAAQFVQQMVQVTGELELQRKSLEVILGSGTAATEMYNQLRDLSQQSPYTFQDLLKAHRQLAAFGIEAKDIYGTMKALTDIGAGLDVDVSRLILAYGHTRAYGYLSGIQNRQFETAGIDMIGGLMDLYNRRADEERKRGNSAEHVSRKDIFSLMRTRDIPFEDVQEVILGLDQPGGKFYNMQERQYNTIGGKLRNLRNNWNIMLSEIGQSGHGLISGALDAINTLTENWQKFADVLWAAVLPLGAVKVAMLALNKAGLAQTAALTKNVQAVLVGNKALPEDFGKWKGIGPMFMAGWGGASKINPTLGQFVSFSRNLKKSIADGSITKSMAMQLAYSKQLPEPLRRASAYYAGMSKSAAAAAAQTKGLSRTVKLLGVNMGTLAMQAGAFARNMLGVLFNPTTAVMGVITAFGALFNWYRSQSKEVENVSKQMREDAARDLETITPMLDDFYTKYTKRSNEPAITIANPTAAQGNGATGTEEIMPMLPRKGAKYVIDEAALVADGIENVIEELDKKLQILDPLYKGDLFDMQKFESETSRVAAMVQRLSDIEYAREVEEKYGGVLASANRDTHWFMTDSYAEDVKDYQKARQKLNNQLLKIDRTSMVDFLVSRGENRKQIESSENVGQYFADYVNKNYEDLKGKGTISLNNDLNIWEYIRNLRMVKDAQDEVSGSLEEMAVQARNLAVTDFKDRPQAYSIWLRDEFNALMGEKGITDPAVIEEQFLYIFNQVVEGMSDDMKKIFMPEIGKVFAGSVMGPEVEAEIKKNLNGRKLSDLTKPELKKLVDLSVKTVRDRLVEKFPLLKSVIEKLFGANSEETKAAINAIKNATKDFDEIWKQEAYEKLGAAGFGNLIRSAQTFVEWIDAAKKKIKEFEQTVNTLRPVLKVKLGMDFTSAKQMRDYFLKHYHDSKGNRFDIANPRRVSKVIGPNGEAVDVSVLTAFYQALLGVDVGSDYMQDNGMAKDNESKTEAAKNKRDAKWRKEDNQRLQNLEKRRQTLQKGYKAYWEWYEKLGKDNKAAAEKVRELFSTAELSDEDIQAIQNSNSFIELYQRYIAQVDEEAKKLHFKDENKDRVNNLKVSASEDINNIRQKQFDDETKKYTSELEQQVKLLEQQYDTYKKIYELTGDAELASRLSGRVNAYAITTTRFMGSKADDLQNRLLMQPLPDGKVLNFDAVRKMSDDEIKRYVGGLMNYDENGNATNEQTRARIEGIAKQLQSWRDLSLSEQNEANEEIAKIFGGLKDLLTQDKVIEGKLAETIEKINKSNASPEEKQRAIGIATQQANSQKLRNTIGYTTLVNNATIMSSDRFAEEYNKAVEDLNKSFAAGTITAQQYLTETDKLNKIQDKYNSQGLFGKHNRTTALLQGGFVGLSNKIYDEAQNRADKLVEGKNLTREQKEELLNNDEEYQGLIKESKLIQKFQDSIGDFNTGVSLLQGAFDGFQKVCSSLAEMYDALGNESEAAFFSDMADATGAISSIFTPINNITQNAMSGNASGMISSVISAPVQMFASPITAFAQLHDKKRQRSIERIQRAVENIESVLTVINRARERSLGTGARLNPSYTYQYMTTNGTAAQKAMGAYYQEAFSNGNISTYRKEYESLVTEREKYMQMYDKEASKKKSSEAAMREYKEKIAELDDQIYYYAEDTAKKLYSVDVKGWADQIGDALMTAFENGTDAAEAFGDAVTKILQSMVKQMLITNILGPQLEEMRNRLFGYRDENNKWHEGVFDINDPEGSSKRMLQVISEFLGDNGKIAQSLSAYEAFFNAANAMVSKDGNTLYNSNDATASSSIKGITEQTADILASYVNAIRADVSVIRQFNATKIEPYMDGMSTMANSMVQYQSQIAANTLRNADAAETIVQSNADILYILNAVVNNTKQMYVKVK